MRFLAALFRTTIFSVIFISAVASHAQDRELRAPAAFVDIQDDAARSRALFAEAAKVIMNPRCMNCHPAAERPLQGNDQHAHFPPAARGENGGGVPGNTCSACHMEQNTPVTAGANVPFQSIPGHPRWGLAPIEMAWEGKSRIPVAMVDAISRSCTNTSRTMIWSLGAGALDRAATLRPAVRNGLAS
jgi:hypothetical protein